jgi:hypothetical protein
MLDSLRPPVFTFLALIVLGFLGCDRADERKAGSPPDGEEPQQAPSGDGPRKGEQPPPNQPKEQAPPPVAKAAEAHKADGPGVAVVLAGSIKRTSEAGYVPRRFKVQGEGFKVEWDRKSATWQVSFDKPLRETPAVVVTGNDAEYRHPVTLTQSDRSGFRVMSEDGSRSGFGFTFIVVEVGGAFVDKTVPLR